MRSRPAVGDLLTRRKLERYSISGNFFGNRRIFFPDRDRFGLSTSQRRGDNGLRKQRAADRLAARRGRVHCARASRNDQRGRSTLIKTARAGGNLLHNRTMRGPPALRFPRRTSERAAGGKQNCADMIKYGEISRNLMDSE